MISNLKSLYSTALVDLNHQGPESCKENAGHERHFSPKRGSRHVQPLKTSNAATNESRFQTMTIRKRRESPPPWKDVSLPAADPPSPSSQPQQEVVTFHLNYFTSPDCSLNVYNAVDF